GGGGGGVEGGEREGGGGRLGGRGKEGCCAGGGALGGGELGQAEQAVPRRFAGRDAHRQAQPLAVDGPGLLHLPLRLGELSLDREEATGRVVIPGLTRQRQPLGGER